VETHVIYQWWRDDLSIKPYHDLTSPVIPAIAVLRAQNPTIPITVLDVSQKERPFRDWGGFPELLNFKVVKWTPVLNQSLPRACRLSSRVWDVWAFAKTVPEHHILFNDSDIFWLKDPLPFDEEKDGRLDEFYCSSNTGVWYFDRRSQRVAQLFDRWKAVISHALIDDNFHNDVMDKFASSEVCPFQDEVAFNYLTFYYPEIYHPVSVWENFTVNSLRVAKNVEKVKNVHALGSTLGKYKGRLCLILKELKGAMERVLTPVQIEMIFGCISYDWPVSVEDVKLLSAEGLASMVEFTGNPGLYISKETKLFSFENIGQKRRRTRQKKK
jgi:hypothetical protein